MNRTIKIIPVQFFENKIAKTFFISKKHQNSTKEKRKKEEGRKTNAKKKKPKQ